MALDENVTAGETGHIAAHATLKSEYDAAGATPGIAAYTTSSTAAQHATIHNALHSRHNALAATTTLPTTLTGTSSGFLAYETALNKAYNLRQAPAATVPNTPAAPAVIAGDSSAVVTWTAPATGGATIIGYDVQNVTTAAVSSFGNVLSATITGLTNGTAYTFKVRAINSVGAGSYSPASSTATPTAAAVVTQNIFTSQVPGSLDLSDSQPLTVGTRFTPNSNGTVSGIRFYRPTTPPTTAIGLLYSDAGAELARVTFGALTTGWNTATFSSPVALLADTAYRAALYSNAPYVTESQLFPLVNQHLTATDGCYVYTGSAAFPDSTTSAAFFVDPVFTNTASTAPAAPAAPSTVPGNGSVTVTWAAPSSGGSAITGYDIQTVSTGAVLSVANVHTAAVSTGLVNGTAYTFKVRAKNVIGVGAYSAASAAVTPSATASAFPDGTNTGYARTGVTLTTYSGPSTLQQNQVIDSKVIPFDLVIQSNVTITRCDVQGRIDCDGAASLILEDCNVNGGTNDAPAVGYNNLTIRRCNIIGGANSVIGGDNTLVEDSWMHAQYLGPTAGSHENAFISNGGTGTTIRHCTLAADQPDNASGGGVSTDCSFFGDFAQIKDVLVENCLIKATPGAYGMSCGYNASKPYGTNPTNVTIRNNTFEKGASGKCGYAGPYTGFLAANGNTFTGNVFDDATPIT